MSSRKKISSNPNNTKWTRDTTTFGQKILRSQGWQPGQYLGAQDAPHADMHSAASASYIRVALKDDMKGLGFDRAKEDEVTGLDVFSDLLSRLNGKSDAAVEEDKQARLVIKTHAFVERRYGPMRFVRGGLLIGDELKEDKAESDEEMSDTTLGDEEDVKMAEAVVEDSDKKSKKRKAASIDEGEESSAQDADSKKRQRKEERKSKKSRSDSTTNSTEDAQRRDEEKARKKEKKEKKKEKKARKEKSRSKDETEPTIDDDADESSDRAKKRKSKSKDKKERSKDSDDATIDSERKKSKKEKKRRKEEGSDSESTTPAEATSAVSTGQSTPVGAGSGTSTPMGNRNFVRSRFIAQKKQAVMDAKALSQVCSRRI